MAFTPPSRERVREAAMAFGIPPDEDVLDSFQEYVESIGPLYERLDELPEFTPTVSYSERDAGYEPDEEEDPYNAILTKCEVAGATEGPLSDYDIGLKDNIAVASVPMTLGSDQFSTYTPSYDATLVERLLEAGGTITAKLNIDTKHTIAPTGPTLNPRDTDYQPGGSSSGSAAAVVGGQVDAAVGVDQGGSIRIPASWCGCVGLKPTYGLVPFTGVVSIEPTFDHAGPMTRTVEDSARMLTAMAGNDPLDPRRAPVEDCQYTTALSTTTADLDVGVLQEGFGWEASDPAVDSAVREALAEFEDAGASLRSRSVPLHRDGVAIWQGIYLESWTALTESEWLGHFRKGFYDREFADAFGAARREHAEAFPLRAKHALFLGSYLSEEYHGTYHAKAQNLRHRLTQAYDEALTDVDVLAMPTVPLGPFEGPVDLTDRDSKGRISNTAPFNATGHPAITVPCASNRGLPVGMMFVGECADDETVLQVANAFEDTVDWES